ncbi:FCD domain-containing protein [Ensifer sp. ENS05]|nr:FCD domain-containing protein [Ensifer sp. ENS05]
MEAGLENGEPTTLANEAYARLRHDMVAGLFPAGEPLRLEALRAKYGYSFSPLREALNRLRSERLVELSALRGFRMSPLSLDEMWDAIETRIMVECQALRLSIMQGGYDWEARVVGAFHSFSRVTESARSADRGDQSIVSEIERHHHDFHFALISASRSRWLNEFAAQLYAHTERYRRPALSAHGEATSHVRDVVGEHKALMDVSIARDVDQAVELLSQHYRKTGKAIEEWLSIGTKSVGGVDAAATAKAAKRKSKSSTED